MTSGKRQLRRLLKKYRVKEPTSDLVCDDGINIKNLGRFEPMVQPKKETFFLKWYKAEWDTKDA